MVFLENPDLMVRVYIRFILWLNQTRAHFPFELALPHKTVVESELFVLQSQLLNVAENHKLCVREKVHF